MARTIKAIWTGEEGQDIAEYAAMLLLILVLVIGMVRLVGARANATFSAVANDLQQGQGGGGD